MAQMTKEEAINYLQSVKEGTAECPLCKQIAARIVMRFPNGISQDLLEFADKVRWQYRGNERHI